MDLPHEVDRLARPLARGRPQLVSLVRPLDLRAHRAVGREEAVRRHAIREPLVAALVVVLRYPVRQTVLGLVEVARHAGRPQLGLHCLPQPLALAQRLELVCARDHVHDPVTQKAPLEEALAAPRVVLPDLVDQHLLRLAEARDPVRQLPHHEVRRRPPRRVGRSRPPRAPVHNPHTIPTPGARDELPTLELERKHLALRYFL